MHDASERRAGSTAARRFFAVTSRGLEQALANELCDLGLRRPGVRPGGVSFRGSLADGYRVCLWSRTAVRVLLELHRFAATTPGELYDGVREVDWMRHFAPGSTLACTAVGTTHALRNTAYAAQVVKDGVVDHLRERTGARPSVDPAQPDIRLHLVLGNGRALLSLDLSGEPLHRRGYRRAGAQGEAPLKETLAAGILRLAGWPELAMQGAALHDPLCGSGTLIIEGALAAAGVAPGLLRSRWGFTGWADHAAGVWSALVRDAERRRGEGLERLLIAAAREEGRTLRFWGGDLDPAAIALAGDHAKRAGLEGIVRFEREDIAAGTRPPRAGPGLVCTNPPYGVRMGGGPPDALYHDLRRALGARYAGWRAAVLIADPSRAAIFGPDADADLEVMNGALPCRLVRFTPGPAQEELTGRQRQRASSGTGGGRGADPAAAAAAAREFANRLRRNHRHLGRRMRREGIDCYRVYDADLPDFALAIDLYGEWAHVQEYAAPPHIDPRKAAARLGAALDVLPAALELDPEKIAVKVRRRQRGGSQYGRVAAGGDLLTVAEGDLRFLVNLTDRIDTGLFPQLRLVRSRLRELADGGTFLNLFGYTGTATVAAARGGATRTLTVDLSNTYLDWARRNFAANGLDPAPNGLRRAECRTWLAGDEASSTAWDLILLAPPTHSRSRGAPTLDLLRDYPRLVTAAARLLAPGGRLLFVAGARRLRLDGSLLPGLRLRDLSRATLPVDFARQAAAHHCWEITRAGAEGRLDR